MKAAEEAPGVLASSVVEASIVGDAGVEIVGEVVAEGKKTSLGNWVRLLAAGGLVGSLGYWRRQMGRRQPVGALAAATCVALLDIHCPMLFRSVLGNLCCYGHTLVEWPCSLLPRPQPPKTECVGPREVLILSM
jgi:hypothetical protein